MQFYNLVKLTFITSVLINSMSVNANELSVDVEQAKKAIAAGELPANWMEQNEKRIKAAKRSMDAQGLLSSYDEESVNAAMQKYKSAAKLIAESSQDKLAEALQEHVGLTQEQAQGFSGKSFKEKETDLGVFVSFSMPKPMLMDAFATAARNGATVYFNGIHPDHEGIHDTMRYLTQMGSKLKTQPMVKLNPRGFQKLNITSVPMIMYRHEGFTVTATGLMNFNWIKTKHADSDTNSDKDLGNFGPVYPVIEENVIEMMKRRLAGIDMEGKKKAAVKGFWKKQVYVELKPAVKDERWLIDPTVKAIADVVNPNGDVLAHRGQVINPLENVKLPLTMYVIDAKNIQQLEWLSQDMNNGKPKGRIKIMTTRIDKEKGWKHLAAIRKHLGREIYIAPKEVIERFKLSATPAKISTDLTRKMMTVEQFNLNGE